MTGTLATNVRIGDHLASLGYVTGASRSQGADLDGIVRDYVTLTLRTKPLSPTGLLRGADNGTLVLWTTDTVAILP